MGKTSAPSTTEPLLILIADDEIPIAETLAEFVMELGYTPLVAYNGQQALALARERWPALVITDQMMPLLSGIDLIRALRTEAATHKTASPPIVLLSAVGASTATDVHVDARLSKPFDLDQLEQEIQLLFGQASRHR